MRDIEEIEDELDELQQAYIREDDDDLQLKIEMKFDRLLDEATDADGKLRLAVGVGITNWVRS